MSNLYIIILTVISLVLTLVHLVSKCYNIVHHHHYYYYDIFLIEITVHPQSINTTLNSTVSFRCEATSALAITFKVNNISAASPKVTSRGFTVQSESLNSMTH